jgi:hypothetical protein
LIDWSWNPLVAAYFAAEGASKSLREDAPRGERAAPPTHLRVWALNREELSFEGADFWKLDVDRIEVVTAASAANPNLAAQKGLFTVVQRSTSAVHLRREPMDQTIHRRMAHVFGEGGGPEHALVMYFLLPLKQAPALLSLLARDGVTAAEVFPGYRGVVQSLKERNFWMDHQHIRKR